MGRVKGAKDLRPRKKRAKLFLLPSIFKTNPDHQTYEEGIDFIVQKAKLKNQTRNLYLFLKTFHDLFL
jgi:hypothetical protein